MGFPFTHVLIVGATSGIGLAFAERLLEDGVKVTAVGRRQDRLDELTRKYGNAKATAIRMDIAVLDKIPQFADEVTKSHPDLDCVLLNAGIQSKIDLVNDFNLDAFQQQALVNFSSYVALTHAFLPFLREKNRPTGIIFTGSNVAIVPAATLPAYSCSKAALNAFVLCLREQLLNSNVKVIELSPPAVQTELHDYLGLEFGRNLGMPLDEYINNTYERMIAGEDQIVVGSIGPAETFCEIINKRRAAFTDLAKLLRETL